MYSYRIENERFRGTDRFQYYQQMSDYTAAINELSHFNKKQMYWLRQYISHL